MNQRDIELLSHLYTQHYGRLDSSTIDIIEMTRGYKKSQMKEINPFLAFAIVEKSDNELRVDNCSFSTLMSRINESFADKKETMVIDSIFKTLDKDGDGFIGIEDFTSMNEQIGTNLMEEEIQKIMEFVSEEGSKLSRQEFVEIFWK